jgi:hypothetical protein
MTRVSQCPISLRSEHPIEKADMAYFKAPSQHTPSDTGENLEKNCKYNRSYDRDSNQVPKILCVTVVLIWSVVTMSEEYAQK